MEAFGIADGDTVKRASGIGRGPGSAIVDGALVAGVLIGCGAVVTCWRVASGVECVTSPGELTGIVNGALVAMVGEGDGKGTSTRGPGATGATWPATFFDGSATSSRTASRT